jgi:Ca2+-binding EF-hand superfamily protein
MNRLLVLLAAGALTSVAFGQADSSAELARGGMHFNARDIDADHNGVISKDEFMKYHADVWDRMTKSSGGSMATNDVAANFARGGMHVNVGAIDADHDGVITREEFMKYEANHWDMLPKDAQGAISVSDFEKAMQARRRKAAGGVTADSTKPD